MKFGKAVLLASVFSVVGSANAAVNVEFATGVESMFVNGDKTFNLLESTENVTLDNGLNQVVVRVSKLIEGQGQLEKYRSDPIVLTFSAKDQTVLIKPSQRIINSVDMSNFNANPMMKLTSKNGDLVDVKIDVLPKNKIGDSSTVFGRNYQKELSAYNLAQGYVIAKPEVVSQPEPKAIKLIGASHATVKIPTAAEKQPVSGSNAMILLQADFIRLSAEQRQAFLKWAKQQ
ncbi:YccT family protein [Photobacterium nomapromontoriensis]|uniref:YccT family protein n=1 Tax=Photobacterium nomapromontoriensis TaxID=2910237 RepID=UPI003D10B849